MSSPFVRYAEGALAGKYDNESVMSRRPDACEKNHNIAPCQQGQTFFTTQALSAYICSVSRRPV